MSDPSVEIKSAEPRWLLIKNPRFGDVASEPEYIWVEEDKVPTTVKTLVFGKSSLIAPPEVVAKYGSPPGGGRISLRQKVPYAVDPPTPTPSAPRGAAASPNRTPGAAAPVAAPPAGALTLRGYVVLVESSRIVIDLAAKDGLRPGSAVSLRRDKTPIVHPVTGEVLGELDEELATARVIEVSEKFSVIEVQNLAPGAEIKVKDRVVVR
ncbi:MAG TPA: FlgT C-terminal domain-containing protein [Candidatus Limnocylindrales bacterium]|nr:FlgT C-terminal domain-containing protein [Candidatus Limnocylindrales bacterium]